MFEIQQADHEQLKEVLRYRLLPIHYDRKTGALEVEHFFTRVLPVVSITWVTNSGGAPVGAFDITTNASSDLDHMLFQDVQTHLVGTGSFVLVSTIFVGPWTFFSLRLIILSFKQTRDIDLFFNGPSFSFDSISAFSKLCLIEYHHDESLRITKWRLGA